MELARAFDQASEAEKKALAAFLIKEFHIMVDNMAADGETVPADEAGILSALAAWAYMQQNAQDQGD